VFANRFTALIDACVLAGALKRNILLSLAEADLFRLRWSKEILDKTERAIAEMLAERAFQDAKARATRARQAMERAFQDAMVESYEAVLGAVPDLPDLRDRHVVAAAMKTRASVIVTDNLKHFPPALLAPLGIDVLAADAFIADTLTLDADRAVAAIRRMRERLKLPEKTADMLLLDIEANGLTETVDVLRPH